MKKKKFTFQQGKILNSGIAIFTIILVSLTFYFSLPIPTTELQNIDDGQLSPFGEITAKNAIETCFTSVPAGTSSIDLLLATYQRVNTNNNVFELFSLQQNQKQILFQTNFSSQSVQDNKFFTVSFPALQKTQDVCFALDSPDAQPGNAITIWLNSESKPVVRFRSIQPLSQIADKIAYQHGEQFHLPEQAVHALFLIYIAAFIFLLCALIRFYVQDSKISKS